MGQSPTPRSFQLPLGASPTEPLSPAGQWVAAATILAALGGSALLPAPSWARGAAMLSVLVAAWVTRRSLVRATALPAGHLVIDDGGVHRTGHGDASTRLARWTEPFGATLLTNRARTRLVLAFTTRERARYVSVDVTPSEDGAAAELVAQASTVGDDDVTSVDNPGARLSAVDARTLVRIVAARSQGALERMFLTSARGEPVELEGRQLRAGERIIDLASPVDHRTFSFHESAGRVATLYQAMWVRQADAELVLIAPLPGEPSGADEPPPREARMAVDRIFLPHLRRVIERAPRASRGNFPSSRRLGERRA